MKISTLLLAGSLAANVALVAVFVAGAFGDTGPAALGRDVHPSAPATAFRAATLGPETWTALRSDDLAAEIERLRAEGFPPAVIRSILAAQIRESFAARRKALEAAQADTPFWKNPVRDPAIAAELRTLSREEDKQLKELLGPDPDDRTVASLRRQFGNLPEEKLQQLRRIQDDHDNQRSDIFSNARNGNLLPDEQQKLNALDKTMHADLAAVLTPEELADYDLRSSNTANQLRFNLAAFDASEQEFRALFSLQQAFNDKFGQMYGPASQDEMKARNEAQNQLNADIKAALGDARYADYQRANDYSYRQASQLVARLELPPETANQVYALQQDIQQRAQSIRRDGSVPWEDRTQQLTTLADEATAKVSTLLGPRGSEAYKQNGGQWIKNLVPRPAITSPVPPRG